MIRLLLSLLALVSGFAVQAAPAARLHASCETEINAAAPAQIAAEVTARAAAGAAVGAPAAQPATDAPALPPSLAPAPRTVAIGIDRAHE